MHSLGPSHALVRIESAGERQDEALSSELMRRSPVPAALVSPPAEGDQAKVPMASRSTVALVRPDLHVAAIYRSRQ